MKSERTNMHNFLKYITIIHFCTYLFSHTLLFSQVIQGHITDPLTGKGISNVFITIGDTSVYTDSTGYYNIDISSSTGLKIRFDTNDLPNKYSLLQNYPNPFNPTTTFHYDLPKESQVNITIYDMLGRKVNQLLSEKQPSGSHSIQWNGVDSQGNIMGAGIYFYQIQAGDFVQTKKMVLMK